MAFQFLCPQGHLLQGEEWQAGQQSLCPYCQSLFLIPFPQGGSPAGIPPGPVQGGVGPYGPGVQPYGPWADAPGAWPGGQPPQESFPAPRPPQEGFPGPFPQVPSPGQGPWESASPEAAEPESPIISISLTAEGQPEASLLHIYCPTGHELETPREMLGQEAICPFCQVQFRLRWEDSLECRRERELEQQRHLARQGRLWMQWSIAAAVAVVIGLIIMIVIAASH